ncbi:MAG: hypothetical protein KA712_11530 [Myxococcales bacterium]|nr:hypothetical protein [Myxococcales bacterium]
MGRNRFFSWSFVACVVLAVSGCDADSRPSAEIFAPLGEIMPLATPAQRDTFDRGRAVVLRRFAPADGLGPNFNVVSCVACHEKPVVGGSAGRYRNFLLVAQRLSDDSYTPLGINGVQDHYTLGPGGRVPSQPAINVSALRSPIPMFGVGLIAELPEDAIVRHADESDADGDGISGRPNFDRGFVGRFGRKSQTVSIEGFIRGPLMNHLGITSVPLSEAARAELPVASPRFSRSAMALTVQGPGALDVHVLAQAAAPDQPTVDADGVPDPELSEQDLFDLVSFSMLLAAPEPDPPTPASEAGRAIFARLGCPACHVPSLRGPRGELPLYSDLLLHDMGPELADGIQMGIATGREFRTQPLWGVAAGAPYLHDGRADTLDEAVRAHGGEAARAQEAYVALAPADRALLEAFLLSLGGRTQASAGLLEPGAAAPQAGQPGGPVSGLSADQAARFARGRRLFDHEFGAAGGLGPEFNGDSCRACHFDPALGGAGPADVDVTRQAIRGADGQVTPPARGTMAHKLQLAGVRPAVDTLANVFETRQTPTLFGLGLAGRIPEAQLVARADPFDADGDGISGRVHRLPDGRLGRFGWKADVPSLAEFVRDALTNELGLTLPPEAGLSFGVLADADAVPDPEIDREAMADLLFFLENLGPPPGQSRDPEAEAQGAQLFRDLRCDACHVPVMTDERGQVVPLFSDLLLHDVAPEGAEGIPGGEASGREFRTPPLWGVGDTSPYMHHGRAFTLEAALAAHNGEAAASAQAYSALPPEARLRLLAFLRSL